MSDHTPTKLAPVVPLPSSSVPSSATSSPPAHSAGSSIASLVAQVSSAALSGFVAWGILRTLPALIDAKSWTHFLAALGALAIVAAPSSALPLLRDVLLRFLPGGGK